MNLYHSNKTTGKFEGIITQANVNPKYHKDTHNIEDKFIYNPKTSSLLKPPACIENECAVLENKAWAKIIDRVGQHFYHPDGSRGDITALGVDIPVGCLRDDPLSKYYDSHDGIKWIENITKKETDEEETLILSEQRKILRSMAIESLKSKGAEFKHN